MVDKNKRDAQTDGGTDVQPNTPVGVSLVAANKPESVSNNKESNPKKKGHYGEYVIWFLIPVGFLVLLSWHFTRELLDKHNGAVSAIGTIAIMLLTIAYVRYSRHQWQVMDGQLEQMRQQLPEIKKSAEAANLNALAVINAERAWIVFELIDDGGGVFRSVMTNYGRTPAQVMGYNIQRSATMTLDDIQNHPAPYEDDPTRPGQPFLVQDEAWDIERIKINDPGWTLPGTVKKPFLYWGVIHYRDTIRNSEHDTWFLRRYTASRNEFLIVGPPRYNTYT
jgi:hypothetical protein